MAHLQSERAPLADTHREGAAASHEAEPSRLLRSLPLEEYAGLLPQLQSVRLPWKDVLVEPNVPIEHVWFLREGAASVLATEQEGGPVEAGVIGPEGFVGLPVLLGTDAMPYRVIMQVAGDAWRLPAAAFRALVDERPAVRRVLLRYAQYYTDQVSQTAACNRLHTVEERCARWLLMTHDRVHGDAFEITHEFLAMMLGVRRAGVTVAMGVMQTHGGVRYSRGRVEVLDRGALERASCGCYRVIRTEYARLFG
ncbi:MAG: Crp/Fnr family transcriptional regulator [Gemmatirosa sp.]